MRQIIISTTQTNKSLGHKQSSADRRVNFVNDRCPHRSRASLSNRWSSNEEGTRELTSQTRTSRERSSVAFSAQELAEVGLVALFHLSNDVQTANQLTVHVQLRISGPIEHFLQTLSHSFVRKDVETTEIVCCKIENKVAL